MSSGRRVTQKDVADRAGVNRATVSLALHNHPSIPQSTRERIRKIAEEMGYRPDPMLSALASYRSSLRPATYHGALAWVVNNKPPYLWDQVAMFADYYKGAVQRAESYGYKIEIFDLQSKGMTPAKLAKALHFRNIGGVFLCPQPGPNWELDLPWDEFSWISFGYSLVRPQLHTVAPTQFRAMGETMRKLKELGYKRIGFAFSFTSDKRADHNFLAGYLVETYLLGKGFEVPPLDEGTADPDKFRQWFDLHRPDAVVTGNPRILEIIAEAGLSVPGDIGVATPTLPPRDDRLAGILEDSVGVGEAAADILVSMVRRGERGVPVRPQHTHVPGIWKPAGSLKAQAEPVLNQ